MKHDYNTELSNELKNSIINDYENNGLSIRDLVDKYNVKSKVFLKKLIGTKIRNVSEAGKNAHKKKPYAFKHSDETKQKLKEIRLAFMKEHPEQTAWRLSKKNISYPERCFLKYIQERGLDKTYEIIREKSFHPFYVDFAFVNIKLAIEIDGSQHNNEDRKKSDEKKDELLNSLGWKVIRITANVVMNDWEQLDSIFNQDFDTIENVTRFGIFTEIKHYQKVEREANGRSKKQNESDMKQRKCERPSREEFEKLINENSFCEVGRMFGVSDNAIRKWCKGYGLEIPKKRKIK